MSSTLLDPRITRWLAVPETPAPLLVSASTEAGINDAFEQLREAATEVILINPDTATISIKDVRSVVATASTTAWQGYRLILIHRAERLTMPAATALLKALEDASSMTRFILLTQWPRQLLATIRSRAISIRLIPSNTATDSASGVDQPIDFSAHQKTTDIDSDTLTILTSQLLTQTRSLQLTPALRRAYQRLRDYHVIRANRGNTRLAKDVLLASLPPRVNKLVSHP